MDINYLIEGLIRGCHSCKEPLRLSSCIGDTRYGPDSLLHIDRIKCHKVTLVPTGTRHGHNVWDINFKLGLAMYFCGIGETAVNTFLGALNLPCFPHNTEKERKRGRSSFRGSGG